MRFRRGMTVLDRQKVRAEVLQRELERAQWRAAAYRLTYDCKKAMSLTGIVSGRALGLLHQVCTGEQPGGGGCLCECHDDNRGGVTAGWVQPPLDPGAGA